MDALVATMLRHAALYGSTDGWDAPVADAFRVDSALSSPSTKYLVAAVIVYAAETQIADISVVVGDAPQAAHLNDPTAPLQGSQRAGACQRLGPLGAQLGSADAHLRDGGDRYTAVNVTALTAGLSAAHAKLTSLQEACSRAQSE